MRTGGFTDEFADRLTDGISEKSRRFRYFVAYAGLLALFAVFFIWNINAGSVDISVKEIFSILFLGGGDETQSDIIRQIRLPRITAAAVLGGALALAGFLLQTFFRNPIAGPFVLGISSGAEMVVAATMVFLLKRGLPSSSWVMILAAFAGALLSMGVILAFSGRIGRSSMLVVCGVMVGYICSAITDFFVTFAEDSDIVNLYNWSMGSFSGIDWDNIGIMSAVVGATSAAVFFCAKPIGAYQMGESYAQSVGVNVRRVPCGADSSLQPSGGLCGGVCRSGFFRRNRGSAHHPLDAQYLKTSGGHSGLFSVRVGVLPVLRSGGQDSVCADGDEHQHGDGHFRCADRHLRPGEKAA